jgi:type IV pilus assembly protein PilA
MSQEDSQLDSISSKGCGCLSLSLFSLIFFGIILEIVMPSFFGMAIKAKQTEGKQYISSMNKGQQAYYAENNALTNSVDALGLGLKTETPRYKYSIRATQTASIHYAVAKERMLKNYVGGVFLVPAKEFALNANRDKITTQTILCETNEALPLFRFKPVDKPAEPTYQNGCGKGTTQVTK